MSSSDQHRLGEMGIEFAPKVKCLIGRTCQQQAGFDPSALLRVHLGKRKEMKCRVLAKTDGVKGTY